MVDNPADNHYFGSVGRIGRALSETQDFGLFKESMMGYLQDEELDELNRMRLYWLYLNCVYHLPEEIRQDEWKAFQAKADLLPGYLADHLQEFEMGN